MNVDKTAKPVFASLVVLGLGVMQLPFAYAQAEPMQGTDGGQMQGMEPSPPQKSRTPIPVLTDADRAAVFESHAGHQMPDRSINSFFLIDQLEWQDADKGSALRWEANGWIGTDTDRLLLRSEGERTNGVTKSAEVQALWGHAISPWWDVVSGVRQDFKPGAPQTWAALGLQGMAFYDLETQATAYLGEGAKVHSGSRVTTIFC